jgi:prepilin-type N-terminal cleavage/methylation domain-containing protein
MRSLLSPSRHRFSAVRAFTLVELLVVIGIIALLVSILLPTLASARRTANTTKCLAALKEIGNGFQMYAIDNRGWWPSARDRKNPDGTDDHWHSWTDLIAKYMHKGKFANFEDIAAKRRSSVIWGCPEWRRTHEYDKNMGTWTGEHIYPGYGMQYYPSYFDNGQKPEGLASAGVGSSQSGYVKASVWQRKPSTERLLIADAVYDIIGTDSTLNRFSGVATQFQPFNPVVDWAATTFVTVDSRHMKPSTKRNVAVRSRYINALFCDLHASIISPKDAYNAIHYPGKDRSIP